MECTYRLEKLYEDGCTLFVNGRSLPEEIRGDYYDFLQELVDEMNNVGVEQTDKGFDLFVEIDRDLDDCELLERLRNITETLHSDIIEDSPLTYYETMYTKNDEEITEDECDELEDDYGVEVETFTYYHLFDYDSAYRGYEVVSNIKG